jgi:dihydrodipicolinate reductase
VDAPSGTALAMGEAIADAMQWKLDEAVCSPTISPARTVAKPMVCGWRSPV